MLMIKRKFIIHPILFGVFPVLFLYRANLAGFPLQVIFLPAAILTCVAALLWGALTFLTKNSAKAALLTSLVSLLSFSYTHVYDSIVNVAGTPLLHGNAAKIALSALGLLLALGVFFIIRARRSLVVATTLANAAATFLVTVSLIGIAFEQLPSRTRVPPAGRDTVTVVPPGDTLFPAPPDIYYIILDGYGRADVLRDVYNYDNSEFLEQLIDRGFFIAGSAHANYCQTTLSLGSSLNMRYLDPAADGLETWSSDRRPLTGLISHNAVMEFLHHVGYTSVAFSTGYHDTEIKTADIYLDGGINSSLLDEFQNGLLALTPVPLLLRKLDRFSVFPTGISHLQSDTHRNRILFTMGRLANIPSQPGAHIIFTHIIMPHPPFLFGSQGAPSYPDGPYSMSDGNHLVGPDKMSAGEYVRKYVDQLSYANQLIAATLDSIFARSARPPIIILQGDHGPGSQLDWEHLDQTNVRERLAILNAYYFPDQGYSCLYNGISPVNTFRVIFNRYFGAHHQLLEDRSFYSTWEHPYEFFEVTKALSAASK